MIMYKFSGGSGECWSIHPNQIQSLWRWR